MQRKFSFGEDELIILGSGGGRYHAAHQYRSTGGIIFRALNKKIQIHIDPGPGAIRDLLKFKINAKHTSYVFLTHGHTDHDMSIPIIIEALQDDHQYNSPKGTIVAPQEYLESGKLENFYQTLLKRVIKVNAGENVSLQDDFSIKMSKTIHGKVQGVGYVMTFGSEERSDNPPYCYKIGFTSDTEPYPEFVNTFSGVDILVANLLRPDSNYCKGHLMTDSFIPLLQEIKPKICILLHFGWAMVNPSSMDVIPAQLQKMKKIVGNDTLIIMGEDGLKLKFDSLIE
jgi:ribonuclease BN (tRNA processing enzyme)